MKVLLIEDSQDIVTTLQLCFKIRWPEAQVVFTNLGMKGIEMVNTEAPDIIILDLGLPDIDGKIVLQEIRKFSTIPLVVLSVRNQESDKVSCLEAGANDYITKPFGALDLIARIKATLRIYQQRQDFQK
jgi:DNA-binding response OmpR family regulator